MPAAYSFMEGAYVRDLLDQPRALERTLDVPLPPALDVLARKLRAARPPLIVLTGMGSSYHALHPVTLRLIAAGYRAVMVETSELIHYRTAMLDPEVAIIAVSQSGRSAEILRLLDRGTRGRPTLIGVTNDARSPLAMESDVPFLLDAGAESSVSCKTYVCTLVALGQTADAFCGEAGQHKDALGRLPGQVDEYLKNWRDHVEEAQAALASAEHMVLAGRGASLAAAGTGGLIIKEAAHFPAEGMSAAAFRHGPLEMVSKALFLLVFRGADRTADFNERLAAEVIALGGSAAVVSEASEARVFRMPQGNAFARPVFEILPVQMITLALAARMGREAGAFERATKVTAVE